jgi:hypothetical protein
VAARAGGKVTDKGWSDFGGRRARYWIIDTRVGNQSVRIEYFLTFRGNQQYEAICQAKGEDFDEFLRGCRGILDTRVDPPCG